MCRFSPLTSLSMQQDSKERLIMGPELRDWQRHNMTAGTTRNERPPRDSAEARAFWRAAGMILLFNGLLVAWVLLKPGGERLSAIVLNAAGFVGPLLVLPLCFSGLLEWMRRRGASQTDKQASAMTGQRWAP